MRVAPCGAWGSPFKAVLFALSLAALVTLLSSPAPATAADPGQALYEQKCKGCHTIGGGRSAGPDLKGVTDRRERGWLIRFSATPDQLIAQGDPIAKQLVQEYGMPMPNMGISQQDAENILAYIEAQSKGTGSSTPSSSDVVKSVPAPAGDAATGKELFTGSLRFQNGAVACISCHNVSGLGLLGGGNLAKDLTKAHASFGSDGLRSMLQTAPFPVMREAYAEHPLTESEVSHLLVFLQSVSAQDGQSQAASPWAILLVGLIGFVPAMGLFHLIWIGRLNGVRQLLVKGGSK